MKNVFLNGIYIGIFFSILSFFICKMVGKIFYKYRIKKGLIHTVSFSLEEKRQRRKDAVKLLNSQGIFIYRYWMPITTMLNDLGIDNPTSELYWAISEFDGECFVFADKKGNQWGGLVPLSELEGDGNHRKSNMKLRIVK